MATANRQSKTQRKGATNSAQRPPAWSGARGSPTFSPANSPRPTTNTNNAPTQSNFSSPLAQQPNGNRPDNPSDRVIQALSGLTGTTITLSTKTGQRYEGGISSTNNEGDTTGVTLKDVKELSIPGSPLKDQLFVASTNIDTWQSGPADAKLTNGDSFRTDIDISARKVVGPERELQAWEAPVDTPNTGTSGNLGDEVTFGLGSNNTASWDQFAANEKLFNITTSFDEDLYTIKLDRTAADYKERERKAQKIANEIISATSSNPHITEERNQVDDSGINEEDKYGAVVRGVNAYIPPGARKAGTTQSNAPKADVPKVSVNAPDGTAVSSQTDTSASSSKGASPALSNSKPPADPLPAFRDFVTNEKQRLTQKRQALVKSEMDKRMSELVKFSQSFKLNKPIPEDLVTILAKDEDKQKQIRDKATKDAASAQARQIGPSNTAQQIPTRGPQLTSAKVIEAVRKPSANAAAATGAAKTTAGNPKTESSKPHKPAMFIQVIPPYKGAKTRQNSQPTTNGATPSTTQSTAKSTSPGPPTNAANAAAATANNKLNVNASSFRPNPKASAFTPGVASPSTSTQTLASASASPKPKEAVAAGPTTPNPFFGSRPVKKGLAVNVKDDFNPFKAGKVADPHTVSGPWPYTGKRYMQMFPPPQHPPQQHSPHMAPPMAPPIPPPSYEEDSAAQAAARGYMYYPSYYPGQPMMPGMPPPGPPGAFMPSPYMQPMPYPPGMPPPNAMYGPPPGMGQMPPGAYMAPPPGTYPPPPNGAGPRPSMPPTPIPAHAHPYYHHSPQLQHAVPYPMMMPPPNVPHPYEGAPAPPVQMGGHA